MKRILFTEEFCQPENLHPFTLTRRMQDLRVGILTIREKWEMMLGLESFDRMEEDYKDFQRSFDLADAGADDSFFLIHGNVLPTRSIISAARNLQPGEFLQSPDGSPFLFNFTSEEIRDRNRIGVNNAVTLDEDPKLIRYPWDLVARNDWSIRQDFSLLTHERRSARISSTNTVIGDGEIFVEDGAIVEHAMLNTTKGPIYIGSGAEVMEGSAIRGPFALGRNAVVKMGAKIYGATSIGPHCIAAGEIKNSIMTGFSNKAHDGYLGDAVIGEWCNMGAGTTNSNLKNNAGAIRMWTPNGIVEAGNKCGVMMGDYSRTSINTSINTGTVIGVSANVFGAGLTPKYVPSFSWGSEGIRRYELDKALRDITAWKQLKQRDLSAPEIKILQHIYQTF